MFVSLSHSSCFLLFVCNLTQHVLLQTIADLTAELASVKQQQQQQQQPLAMTAVRDLDVLNSAAPQTSPTDRQMVSVAALAETEEARRLLATETAKLNASVCLCAHSLSVCLSAICEFCFACL